MPTVIPGRPVIEPVDQFAPNFELFIEDFALVDTRNVVWFDQITQRVVSISWENTLDITSEMTIEIDNSGNFLTDATVFSPGNEVELHLGYGANLDFVGRAEIVKHLPTFPSDGAPIIQVIAHDLTWRMKRQEIDIKGRKTPRRRRARRGHGVVHRGTVGQVVRRVVGKYGLRAAVDLEFETQKVTPFLQRKGVTDYNLLRSLANRYDAEFFIAYIPGQRRFKAVLGLRSPTPEELSSRSVRQDTSGGWIAVFRKPHGNRGPLLISSVDRPGVSFVDNNTLPNPLQDKQFKFVYDSDDPSDFPLIEGQIDWSTMTTVSEIQISVFNRKTRRWDFVSKRKGRKGKDPLFRPPKGALSSQGNITSMTELKLAMGGFAVNVATRPMRNAAEARRFVERWFNQHKDEFVILTGSVPGIPSLRAGQTHVFEGVGNRYSGEYYLSSVTHRQSGDAPYVVEFTARKILKGEFN
jgi:phage protein D